MQTVRGQAVDGKGAAEEGSRRHRLVLGVEWRISGWVPWQGAGRCSRGRGMEPHPSSQRARDTAGWTCM